MTEKIGDCDFLDLVIGVLEIWQRICHKSFPFDLALVDQDCHRGTSHELSPRGNGEQSVSIGWQLFLNISEPKVSFVKEYIVVED